VGAGRATGAASSPDPDAPDAGSVVLALHGRGPVAELAARLQEVDGVLAVHAGDPYADT
jgi:hypothetical protein